MNEREIFTTATQIEDSKLRSTFLETVCQGDLLRRHRIECLLRAEAAGSLIDRPSRLIDRLASEAAAEEFSEADSTKASGPESSSTGSIQPGTTIGPYQIQQLLGEGGMGVVYVASQSAPIKRLVALKVLRPGDSSRNVLARFERERQALAMMDHPGIARILDAGTTSDGRPYFAMELVKGIPISDYCDQENLSPQKRLELFIPVCDAIQHAHQKGIIHRDLKPSNILIALVDGQPIPKVIDFGVAKAIGFRLAEESVYTEVGSIVGTIEYMAPEQAELNNLDIDTRADVYALGVLLYELLTGSPPFSRQQLRNAAFDEMLRIIREVDPPKPSTKISSSNEIANIAAHRKLEPRQLSKLLSGDLDWVVMKALAKERQQRYQSVGDLSADVNRFLNMEAVAAGPLSVRYKFGKFVKRNRTFVASALLMGLTLATAVIGTSYGLKIALRENKAKTIALESEKQALADATSANDRTHAALRSLTDKFIISQLARQTELSPEDRMFLDEIRHQYIEFASSKTLSKHNRAIRCEGLMRHAVITKILGETISAKKELEQAAELWTELTNEFPGNSDWYIEQAECFTLLGDIERDGGHFKSAESFFRKAIEKLSLAQDVDSIQPESLSHKISGAHHLLGMTLFELNRHSEAIDEFSEALSLCELNAASNPDDSSIRIRRAEILNSMANQLNALGKFDEALERYVRAIELTEEDCERVPNWSQSFYQLGLFHGNLGRLYRRMGNHEKSGEHLSRAVQVHENLVENYPVVSKYRSGLVRNYQSLATLELDRRQWETALDVSARGLKIGEQLTNNFPAHTDFQSQVADLHFLIGRANDNLGRKTEALKSYQQAQTMLAKIVPARPEVIDFQQELALVENSIGLLLQKQGNLPVAGKHLGAALEIREKLIAAHPDVVTYSIDLAGSLCNYGGHLYELGRFQDTTPYYERAEELLKKVLEKTPRADLAKNYLRNVYAGRLRACSRLEKYDEAIVFADLAIGLDNGTQELVYQKMKLFCQAHVRPEEAIAGGEQLIQRHPENSDLLYRVAGFFSIASENTESADLRIQYQTRAIELLKACHSTGMFMLPDGRPGLLQDPVLTPIRQHADFIKLQLETTVLSD